MTTLFGLLMWDIIFAPIPGAFETPYQSAPLDLIDDTFYFSRKEMIEARLEEIRAGKAPEVIVKVDAAFRETKTWCVGVMWDRFERRELLEIVNVSVLALIYHLPHDLAKLRDLITSLSVLRWVGTCSCLPALL